MGYRGTMKKGLYGVLRNGLDFEGIDITPEDLVGDVPDEHYDSQQRASKRRRVEAIANQYMKGGVPVILSARLRGPFGGEWNNPWAKKGQRDVPDLGKTDTIKIGNRTRAFGAAINKRNGNVRTKATRRSAQMTTPKGARTVDVHPIEPGVGRLQSGGKIEEGENHSGTTELLSLEHSQQGGNRTGQQIPAWPKRSPAQIEQLQATTPIEAPYEEQSPSQSRNRRLQVNASGALKLAPPKFHVLEGHQPCSAYLRHYLEGINCRRDASASMVMSSPLGLLEDGSSSKTNYSIHKSGQYPQSHLVSAPTAVAIVMQVDSGDAQISESVEPHDLSQYDQHSQPLQDEQFSSKPNLPGELIVKDLTVTRSTEDLTGPHSSRASVSLESAIAMNFHEANCAVLKRYDPVTQIGWRPSREEIRQSAERCVNGKTTSLASSVKRPKHRRSLGRGVSRDCIPHNLVASPTSSGFMYRKKGESKAKGRAKPRPMTFEPPPAAMKDKSVVSKEAPREKANLAYDKQQDYKTTHSTGEGRDDRTSLRLNIYDLCTEDTNNIEQSFSASRASLFSTQTGLRLAQLDFQQGMPLSLPSNAQLPILWRLEDTPQPPVSQEGRPPAITPFHTFNAELDKRFPPDRVNESTPRNTQDMLADVSPFTFSTVKKKSAMLQRSSLRFAVLSHEDEGHTGVGNDIKSRAPLKDRNSKVSFRSAASEKGSQDSPLQLQVTSKDVELPQLDFHTSLDDLGNSGDLGLTDRFLRTLDGMA